MSQKKPKGKRVDRFKCESTRCTNRTDGKSRYCDQCYAAMEHDDAHGHGGWA